MKKVLFIAASAVFAMSSCSDYDLVSLDDNGETPITLDVYQQGQTRATETTITTLQASGFKLMAATYDAALKKYSSIIDETVSYTGNAWSYGDVVNWPATGSVEFFAFYTPFKSDAYDPSVVDLTNSSPSVNLPINGDADIVAAAAESTLAGTLTGTYGNVALQFGHILSEVAVSVKGADAGFTYAIKKITVEAPEVITYYFKDNFVGMADGAEIREFTYFDNVNGQAVTTTIAPIQDADNKDVMLFLPVMSDGSKMTVTYTVSDNNLAGVAGYTPVEYTKWASVILAQGKLNRINLTLPSTPTAITLSVGVDNWADQGTNSVNVGSNDTDDAIWND